MPRNGRPEKKPGLKELWYTIIFEAETSAGKRFDIILLVAILLSVMAVILESVSAIRIDFGEELRIMEWVFTVIFTMEYLGRLYVVKNKIKYAISFFGIVDLISIIPTYLSFFLAGTQTLLVIRSLRLLRVFRVMKLVRYLEEAGNLSKALKASKAKILVFLGTVFILVILVGTLMYLIEGPKNGFTSIPTSIYWAVVTLTTVGYGDIAPQTVLGQSLASIVMIMGYGIIAVPTGIVSAEMVKQQGAIEKLPTQVCSNCMMEGHDIDAIHCKHCGAKL